MPGVDITAVSAATKITGVPNIAGALRDALSMAMSTSDELLNAAMPDRYPLYSMQIQVVDFSVAQNKSSIVEEFDFDVMPESLSVPHEFKLNVVPTMKGNYTLSSLEELPSEFQVTGLFGLKHRFIFNLNANKPVDKFTVLTGYGLVKRLEKVIKFSKQSSATGEPYRTFLINQAFNTFSQVEIKNVTFNQDISRNGLWAYNITFVKVSDDSYTSISAESRAARMGRMLLNKLVKEASNALLSPLANQTMAMTQRYI